jgi:hypothetical protein
MYATEVKNNYKAKLLLHELFDKKDSQNLLWQEPCKGAKTDSRENFGKEIVARVGTHKRPKWVPYYGGQADSGRGQDGSGSAQACSGLLRLAQAMLRLAQDCSGYAQACSGSASAYSPSAQACSPSAQVKAAVAHIRRLKWNQRKGKLILSL